MDSNLMIGLVVSALVVLVGLFISLATPLIKLNKTIQRLSDQIDNIQEHLSERDKQIKLLHNEVNDHSRWLQTDKLRLDNHEARLEALDHRVGYKDDEKRT
jgi:cell division protein FtsL